MRTLEDIRNDQTGTQALALLRAEIIRAIPPFSGVVGETAILTGRDGATGLQNARSLRGASARYQYIGLNRPAQPTLAQSAVSDASGGWADGR